MGSAVGGVVDAFTADVFDFDKSKKYVKDQERKLQEKIDKENKELAKKKKDAKDKTLGFYESLRGGNVSLLAPAQQQVIG